MTWATASASSSTEVPLLAGLPEDLTFVLGPDPVPAALLAGLEAGGILVTDGGGEHEIPSGGRRPDGPGQDAQNQEDGGNAEQTAQVELQPGPQAHRHLVVPRPEVVEPGIVGTFDDGRAQRANTCESSAKALNSRALSEGSSRYSPTPTTVPKPNSPTTATMVRSLT